MPYGPKNLKISFAAKNLTRFAGIYLMSLFIKRLRLRQLFRKHLMVMERNSKYSIAESMLALMYPMMIGMGRIAATYLLKRNSVFHYLTGLPTYPNPTTLRRFLLRTSETALEHFRMLHDHLLQQMVFRPHAPSRVIFDLDSTVLTVYGKQELARIGYNPAKPGRPSYHPLLCFESITKDFWHGELRSGDTHTATGTLELVKAVFEKLPASVKTVVFRADKGFFDHKIVDLLEDRKSFYIIVARATRPIKERLSSLSYESFRSGLQASAFQYQPHGWKEPHRFVVIRRPIPDEPNNQLTLFTLGSYSYQIFVTNLHLKPYNVWKFYNGRAAVELIIKELKADYPLAKIPTHQFAANAFYFHLLLFSYNLINWFKRLCLPAEFQAMTLNTLRTEFFNIPGELVHTANRPVLKLPTNFYYKDVLNHTVKKISKLKF